MDKWELNEPKDGWPFYACSGDCGTCHMDVAVYQGRLYCYDCLDDMEVKQSERVPFTSADKKRIAELEAMYERIKRGYDQLSEVCCEQDDYSHELEAEIAKLREALDDLLEQCTTEAGDPEDYIKALYRGNEVLKEAE